ncbi:MAG: addB [Firmicutes bacterium]|nr:addB [Bacillota bacterium]
MHNLYCTPLGESSRAEFVRRIVEDGQEIVYLLPSIYLLTEVRQTMRQTMQGYHQPQMMLFDDLVVEIVQLAGGRQQVMSSIKRELIMEKVLADLTADGRLPYFGTIAAFPSYVGAVNALVTEIKRTGTLPEELASAADAAAEARGNHPRDREVVAIYDLYQDRLKQYNLADMEEMYFWAIVALAENRVTLPYRRLYISEFDIFTPLQLEVVRQLRPMLEINIGLMYEKNRPNVFQAVEPTYAALVGAGFNVNFLAKSREKTAGDLAHIRNNLYATRPVKVAGGGQAQVVSTPNPAKEMAVTAGKIKKLILEQSFLPEDIVVVVRDKDKYADFSQICTEYKLPLNLARTECVGEQPLFTLLTAVLEAKSDGGSRDTVMNVLKSPFVEIAFGLDADSVEQAALKCVINGWADWLHLKFADYRLQAGLNTFYEIMSRLPESDCCEAWTKSLNELLLKLKIPLILGERYQQGLLSLTDLKTGLVTFAALKDLVEKLADDFKVVGQQERDLSVTAFLRYFRQAGAQRKLNLSKDNGGIKVVTPAEARGAVFGAAFVLGLADGEFPRRERDSWLFNERDRALFNELGVELMTSPFRRAEENLYFAVAVSLADKHLVLSCREDAEILPSPYVDEIRRLFVKDTVSEERYTVSDIFAGDYQQIYGVKELIGRTLIAGYSYGGINAEKQAVLNYVLAKFVDSDFERRVEAEAERIVGKLSRYNGLVGGLESIVKPDKYYSITALEAYAACPFRYLASQVLKLGEWEVQDEETGADVIGTLYHSVLALFMREHLGERLWPEHLDDYYAEIKAALDNSAKRLMSQGKIISGKWWSYRRIHLLRALRRWLDFEVAEQGSEGLAFTPAWLEWGFGLPVTDDMDGASTRSPLKIGQAGTAIELVGKVDRVDRSGDTLAIIDYKRKTCPQFSDLDNGLDLQAALYIMAVEQLLCPLEGQVAGGGYYSIEGRKKDGGMWRNELVSDIAHRIKKKNGNLDAEGWRQLQEKISQRVIEIAASIKAGRFMAKPADNCSGFCVARQICRFRQSQPAAGGEEIG